MSIYMYEERRTCSTCLRYLMIVGNIVLGVIGAGLIAVFVYFLITQVEFVRAVLRTDLVVTSCVLLIAAGSLLLFLAVFGIISGVVNRSTPYAVYFTLLIPVFLALVAGVVCALVFKTWLTDEVRHKMMSTLKEDYGVNLDNEWNRKVTESWDKAQSMWQCCSVDEKSWYVYADSNWYKAQEGTVGAEENWKPRVPKSCCKTASDGSISLRDLKECQSKQNGPPSIDAGGQYAGEYNHVLYYRGCYEAAQDYLIYDLASWFGILVGIGSASAIVVFIAILFAVALFCTRRRESYKQPSSRNYIVDFQSSQRSGAVLY